MDEPTEEELRDIVRSFMENAPPGEFMEVVTDIRGLVEDEQILNDVVPEAFEKFNVDQMLQVENGDHSFLVCEAAQVGNGQYLDPHSLEVVEFDHITRKVRGTSESNDFSGPYEEFRQALESAVDDYVHDHYAYGTGCVYNANDGLIIAISASKFEPRNFWSGRWTCLWKCTFEPRGAVALKGDLKVLVHFYEDGNVQLNATHSIVSKAKGGNPAQTAKFIIKAITSAENKYQQAIDGAYASMDQTTFKALRRQLPVTACKIDWDKIAHAKIGNNAAN